MSPATAEIFVSGVVQGVGYRYYCYQLAVKLNLYGRVKNQYDGSVFLSVEGERGMIEELIKELRVGPPASSVSNVTVNWLSYQAKYKSFEISR